MSRGVIQYDEMDSSTELEDKGVLDMDVIQRCQKVIENCDPYSRNST